ncbi:redoxin domain-containing protein [Arachidicoccus sp.]|uniref:redoxin domain-containing protein n=1 Tax=Arachidicoccus sp. TaxID=1872624 RepID=UPI003D25554A
MKTVLKKYVFAALALTSGSLMAQSKSAFMVKGHINGLADGEVYLAYGSFINMKADTVQVKDGNFEFKDVISEPCYGMLFNHDYTLKVDLFVDRGNISIKGDIDSAYDIHVSGSPFVNEYAAYNQAVNDSKKPVQAIYEKWIAAYNSGDSDNVTKYKAAFNAARDKQGAEGAKLQLAFIKDHPNNNASAWELFHYLNEKSLENSKAMFANFSDAVRNSEQGKEVSNRIATLSRVEVGHYAPGFEQKSVNDKAITLASYKGKYVLLEFWASWCEPCRAESPNVLAAYNKYKSKGFDVLSVSLDHVKKNWEQAIQKDGLLWTQVSDLKGWKNEVATLYGIQAVPANFLIDPTGKIVAENLRGDDLNNALQKFLVDKK